MNRFIEGEDRSQSTLFPEHLDDYIAEDNPVRVIDVFVDEADLQRLGTSLPAFLMPVEFTLTELQRMYEILLARELEKKAFRTRFLAAKLIDPLPRMKSGANRPARLYRLKPRRQIHLFSRPFGSASSPRG